MIFADGQSGRVLVLARGTGTFYGRAMTAGNLYSIAGDGTDGYSGDGGPATAAQLSSCNGVAVDAAGNVLIADTTNNRIRVVAVSSGTFYGRAMTKGDIYTIAGNGDLGYSGDGGPAASAELSAPEGMSFDAAGNLVIADVANTRIRVLAASTGTFYGQAMTRGDVYTIAGNGKRGTSGDGGPATSAEFEFPSDVAVDGHGNVVVSDYDNDRIQVVAGSTGTFYGVAMTTGDVYTLAGGRGKAGFAGDGGPATGARLFEPLAVAVDSGGNLLISDQGNGRIREVTG